MRKELQQYLDGYGVRQKWVAEQMGVSRQLICYYLSGKRGLGRENQNKLRELLDRVKSRAI